MTVYCTLGSVRKQPAPEPSHDAVSNGRFDWLNADIPQLSQTLRPVVVTDFNIGDSPDSTPDSEQRYEQWL